MRHSSYSTWHIYLLIVCAGAMAGLIFAIMLLLAPFAFASYEQVSTFSEASGQAATYHATGAAVNATGAGGVTAGTLYVVSSEPEGVVRYGPKGEFLGQWGQKRPSNDVAVDQTTGDVYVLRTPGKPGEDAVTVYSPDGAQIIGSFGEFGAENDVKNSETFAETPEKVHSTSPGGIAIDDSGTVYISDESYAGGLFESRVMAFKPQSPGDYEHYVYEGRAHDLAYSEDGDPIRFFPRQVAVDSSGNLYTAGEELITEFRPSEPSVPACTYKVPGGGVALGGITVNPQSGEVYYFSYKHPTKVFQLSACNAEGTFQEKDAFALSPGVATTSGMYALAFNPTFTYEASRPAGVLYGIAYAGLGYILAPAEVRSPLVESESVASVDSSSATLSAQVDPNGSITRYVFQYISNTAYQANEADDRFAGASEAPSGGGPVGSGKGAVSVDALLSGLTADTEYDYRVVASSNCNPADEAEVCEGVGTVQSFSTYPLEPLGLPDGRAYELVSPPEKNGGEVFPLERQRGSCECKPGNAISPFPYESAPDGESVVYQGYPFSSSQGAVVSNEYLSRRTASGWQTTFLSPALQSTGGLYLGFDPNLSMGVLTQESPTLSSQAPAGYTNLYAESTAAPSAFAPLLSVQPPDRSPFDSALSFAGGSADFSRLFFSANDALTSETPFAPAAVDAGAGKGNLYESHGGELQLVNVLPGNTETAPGAVFGTEDPPLEGNQIMASDFSHAISSDGSRVFWSDGAGQVYVRENGESTLAIPDAGRFLTASADGSRVLLRDGHIYDLETTKTTDLTGGLGGFQGIVGQSEDLSHIFFVDTAVLTGEEANEQGVSAQSGKDNLYAWDEGAATFVATLEPNDNDGLSGGILDWVAGPQLRTAEASPDGRWVAFMSTAPLTGYDNSAERSAPGVARCSGGCTEVFLYDSKTGRLTCASCDRSGVRPLGPSYLPVIEGAIGSFAQPRYLTDQGRLYFNSQDSLSPFDTNHGVEDVYQYEPGGIGDCGQEQGCVRLISGGRGPIDSDFLAADATGKNVFFTTRDQLVAGDHDELLDLYDAREGGGVSEEAAKTECDGETCQPSTGPVGEPALASLSFESAGDLVPSPVASTATAKSKRLSRAQKLARALRECKSKPRRKRAVCQSRARKRFGSPAKGSALGRRDGGR